MIRKTLLAITAALPLVVAAVPAHADPDDSLPVSDTVVLVGSGNSWPGPPCVPCTVHLGFTAEFAGDDGVDVTDCDFDGTGVATLLAGSGGGTINCSNGSSGSVTFTRTGPLVQIGGTVTVKGSCHTVSAVLVAVPENVAPTTNFLLTGAGILADCPA